MTSFKGFSLGQVQILHKTATRKTSDAKPKITYDLLISITEKKATEDKPAVVVRTFGFSRDFVVKEHLDHEWTSSAVDGKKIKTKFDETFSLITIVNEVGLFFVKVSEKAEEIHAFPANDGKGPKSTKITMTAAAAKLQELGVIKNEIGEKEYFTLVTMLNEDGTPFSTPDYLAVYGLEKIDVEAQQKENAEKAESAPAVNDEPSDEEGLDEEGQDDLGEGQDDSDDDDLLEDGE